MYNCGEKGENGLQKPSEQLFLPAQMGKVARRRELNWSN